MKTLQSVGTLVFTLALFAACHGKEGAGLANVSALEFSTLIQAKGDSALLIDVRTPEEFQGGHIAGALSIDFQGSDFAAEVAKLPKDKPVLVYCRSGRRSKAAMPVFLEAGFKQVTNLSDGIVGWQKAGLPVSKN